MNKLDGLGKKSRERLALLIRKTKGTISLKEAASILNWPEPKTALFVSRLCKNGWLNRVQRGVYVSVPMESNDTEPVLDDPWGLAQKLFDPCYIGGWSAAEYWDMTEQIFRSIVVVTSKVVRIKKVEAGGAAYFLKMTKNENLFGTKEIWKNNLKVKVSDPTKTIIDILSDPEIGGGIRPSFDVLKNYLSSKNKDMNLLLQYGDRLGNRVVFKRLGFLIEKTSPEGKDFLGQCLQRLSEGYSKLDPSLKCEKIITKWKLWVPESWANGNLND